MHYYLYVKSHEVHYQDQIPENQQIGNLIDKKLLLQKNDLQHLLISNENIIGVQFHPEKSGTQGLKFLENFINWKI